MRNSITDPEEALRAIEAPQEKTEGADEVPPVTTIDLDTRDKRGRRYTGRFYFRVPNIGDTIKMGQLKAVMLPNGAVADPQVLMLVSMLCYLQVCIEFNEKFPKPDWYKPNQMYDVAPFNALYARCLEYEARFLGEHTDDRADEGGAERQEERTREGADHVGRKVRPPAQRRETLAGDGA